MDDTKASEPKQEGKYTKDLMHLGAGSLARMTAAIIMCPSDIIKTRIQFQAKHSNVVQYKSFTDAFFKILADEGVYGFTKGLGARLIYVAPSAGISFFFYENIVKNVRVDSKTEGSALALVLSFLGLTCARVVGTTLRTPFDVVKNRMQVAHSIGQSGVHYKNWYDATIKIGRAEGWSGLFGSAHVAFARDAPFALIYYMTYEVMKDVQCKLFKKDDLKDLGIINHILGGGTAGAIAASITTPIDVVKTRLQTQASLPPASRKYTGMFHAFRTILAEEGYRGFLTGLLPRVLYIAPSAAIVWASYEQYKRLLDYLM